jgi:flagellar hook-associated protein 1 FlgK
MMDISRWALQASTKQLDTVSHNVANVNTPGYSRQEAVLSTRTPQRTAEGWYGSGVQVSSVIQHVDKLLQERITSKATDLSYYDSRLSQLTRLESLCNEAGDSGLGQEITQFFSAWQDVSNNPDSTAVREALRETANNLISRLQTVVNDVGQVGRDLDGYISNSVDKVNDDCRRIAELNDKILASEQTGQSANDFRDERESLVEDLSKRMNIQWFEDGRGCVAVFTSQGKTLVQDNYPRSTDDNPLSFETVAGYTDKQLVWHKQDIVMGSSEVSGGEIGSWLGVRDVDIPEMQSFLNGLAKTIIGDVNTLHSSGVGLDKLTDVTGTYASSDPNLALNDINNQLSFKDLLQNGTVDIWGYNNGTRAKVTINVSPSDSLVGLRDKINNALTTAGINVAASITSDDKLKIASTDGSTEFAFANDTSNVLAALGINTFFDGDSASSITLSSTVAADVRNICAGRLTSSGEHTAGDNSNALDIADLKDANSMTSGTQTFNEAVISWSSALGTAVSTTQDNKSFAETTSNQMQTLRDNVSSVNLDEEMVKMIQFQRSYQMAAKLINVADTLLSSLLETVR